MCKVSVLIPIYNVERYLPECMDSLLAQSLKDMEFICINDGSTDDSLAILQRYAAKDARVQIIDQQNGGYGKAMNAGLKAAKGEYIGIVESDDFVDADMFEALYNQAEHYQIDLIKSDFFAMKNGYTNPMGNLKEIPCNEVVVPRETVQKAFYVAPSIWSAIYKRDFLEKYHIVFHETPGASYQDVSFFVVTMACAQRAVFIPEAYLHYRMDNINSSVHSKAKVGCIFDEFAEIQRFVSCYPQIQQELKEILSGMKGLHYIANYHRIGQEYKKIFLNRMADEFEQDVADGLLDQRFWKDEDWNFVQRLLADRKQLLFEEYVRLQRGQLYVKGFLDVLLHSASKIYLYGAGKVGKQVLLCLRKQGVYIDGFLVSMRGNNPEKVGDIPVTVFSEAVVDPARSLILLSVGEKRQYDILTELQSMGFEHCIVMTLELRSILESMS